MCGIVGLASIKAISNFDSLDIARDSIIHRGPDDFGTWWSSDCKVGFAHRRLSIIDLTQGAKQPMLNIEENLCITFNGEIYNYLEIKVELLNKGYQFKTESDTEVILNSFKEWGLSFVNKLIGMFAIAIYDLNEQTLILLRDRAGEKPLYYSNLGGAIYFGSEIKALLSFPELSRNYDVNSLGYFLSYGYSPSSQSIVNGISKLCPGHYMKFCLKTGKMEIDKYWDFNQKINNDTSFDSKSLVDELSLLLEDSVRIQLHADVPVGVLLSGGLDSSLVTAISSKFSHKLKTFNVTFPDFPDFDESKHARLIANHFETDHYELVASKIEPEILIQLAEHYDDPIIDSSIIPTDLVSKLVKEHCTVALGGDGGDELFGGYKTYSNTLKLNDKIKRIPLIFRIPLVKIFSQFTSNNSALTYWLEKLDNNGGNYYSNFPHFFNIKERKSLFPNLQENFGFPDEVRKGQIPDFGPIEEIAMRMDFLNYMPNDILVKVDKASMLNSLELRAPLLDYRIIEFAFKRVPNNLKVTKDDRKIILKEVAKKYLPNNFDYQRKKGFSIPINSWLKTEKKWIDFSNEVLLESKDSIFDRKAVQKLLRSQSNNGEKIFGLLMLQLFQNKYRLRFK